MAGTNRGVVYTGPGSVEVHDLDYPKLELPEQSNRQLQHGVILKVVATNICGSDQHMVRGRTTAPEGQTLGHEITGEVAEVGRDVEFIKQGDLVSVPFNIACGRCRNCKERNTGVCENVNPARAGAAYGYVDMGGWLGGQAEYVTVPYADWNLLKFPDRDQAMEKMADLAMLSDIFPTGYHGAWTAGVTTGSTVYVAGAGPVGLACATSAHLLGAAVVIVGDMQTDRLAQAASFGCETIDLSAHDDLREQLQQILGGAGEVDAAVDCVGFEARGHGTDGLPGRGSGDRAELGDGHHQGGRAARDPRAVRDRRPGRGRRAGQGRVAVDPDRARLGQVPLLHHRPVPGDEVQPPADDGDPPRQGADRQERQRDRDPARPGPPGLPGVRQGRGPQVRPRPARHGRRLAR